jgi:hypothetical protein
LGTLRFVITNGIDQKYVAHDLEAMRPILRRVKSWVKKDGKDAILRGWFEGTGCSFALYEKIYKRPNERLIVCPFREGIEHNKAIGSPLTIDQVCTKYCIPRWTGYGKECGVKTTVTPGEICSIKIA